MTDYCKGILFSLGCIIKDSGKEYYVVRNKDRWYVDKLSDEIGYNVYPIKNIDGSIQWCIKLRNVKEVSRFYNEIESYSDFLRPYIEVHGVLDLANRKSRKGDYVSYPRLRIYGSHDKLSLLNNKLPAKIKTIQKIKSKAKYKNEIYEGETCALYYQSWHEIEEILNYIDGNEKNSVVWNKWAALLQQQFNPIFTKK